MDRSPAAPSPGTASEQSLLEAAHKLQVLARRLVEAEELERHRIAGELHDRVGQTLSAININLDIALGLLPPDNVEVRMRIADSLALVEGTLQAIEHLMAELRPPLLDEYGLGAALGFLAKGFSARTGVACAVEDPHEVGRSLPRDAAVALFRIAQEALANVFKHAAARHARIRLEAAPGGVRVEIADDGSGFDRRERLAQHHRWGMTTMQERAAAVGGRIEVESAPGAGTLVRAWVPLAGPAQGGSA